MSTLRDDRSGDPRETRDDVDAERPAARRDGAPSGLFDRLRALRGAGRRIRRRLLAHGRELLGVRPTPGFPRVFGVLVDWPVAGGAVSVFAASTGVAMLLSSSNDGPLGDDRRLTVRVAARELVLWADDAFDLSLPVDDYPYPEPGRVHVYLLTFDGLRRASTEIASLESGSNPLGRIHRLGRAVLSELRWPADPEG